MSLLLKVKTLTIGLQIGMRCLSCVQMSVCRFLVPSIAMLHTQQQFVCFLPSSQIDDLM